MVYEKFSRDTGAGAACLTHTCEAAILEPIMIPDNGRVFVKSHYARTMEDLKAGLGLAERNIITMKPPQRQWAPYTVCGRLALTFRVSDVHNVNQLLLPLAL
ncbi:hypothetical protein FGG08_002251 [Glutinoglossum americanum]|uniref:Uncharacterized protein n=1 Tax=Glutinoglossum americanum TaxID=1670608 RepID=A0A9P8IFF7_9PEZI|nr:hypothetical protein FGG08_002251 [Glutinoglossum americanum]